MQYNFLSLYKIKNESRKLVAYTDLSSRDLKKNWDPFNGLIWVNRQKSNLGQIIFVKTLFSPSIVSKFKTNLIGIFRFRFIYIYISDAKGKKGKLNIWNYLEEEEEKKHATKINYDEQSLLQQKQQQKA